MKSQCFKMEEIEAIEAPSLDLFDHNMEDSMANQNNTSRGEQHIIMEVAKVIILHFEEAIMHIKDMGNTMVTQVVIKQEIATIAVNFTTTPQ